MIAVVRVRGKVGVRREIEDTLRRLGLERVNWCVVLPEREEYMGMVKKVKDYVTWGEVNEEVLKELVERRGERDVEERIKEGKPAVFRLHPPSRGWERKGIKRPYSLGGALGYRGEAINDLLRRMM